MFHCITQVQYSILSPTNHVFLISHQLSSPQQFSICFKEKNVLRISVFKTKVAPSCKSEQTDWHQTDRQTAVCIDNICNVWHTHRHCIFHRHHLVLYLQLFLLEQKIIFDNNDSSWYWEENDVTWSFVLTEYAYFVVLCGGRWSCWVLVAEREI